MLLIYLRKLEFTNDKSKYMDNWGKPIEILLIEDNEGDILLTAKAFEEAKINNELRVCRNGQEGLDYLFRRGKYVDAILPDIILLDLNMPGISGQEVLEKIKNTEVINTIPVVILTTSESEKDIQESYQLHANSYIKKPVNFEQFVHIVKQIQSYWFTIVKFPTRDRDEIARNNFEVSM